MHSRSTSSAKAVELQGESLVEPAAGRPPCSKKHPARETVLALQQHVTKAMELRGKRLIEDSRVRVSLVAKRVLLSYRKCPAFLT